MLFATSIKLYPNKNDASICMETGQPIKGIYQISRARSNVFFFQFDKISFYQHLCKTSNESSSQEENEN